MSDNESNFGGWGKKDNDCDASSPYRPDAKRVHSHDSFHEEPKVKRPKLAETQPPMLLFKHFLNKQEHDILVEDAMKKYNEYKEAFACEQLQAFFELHKDEEWFREKYHPEFIEEREKRRLTNVSKRNEVYLKLKSCGWLDDVEMHINYQDSLIKILDAVCIFLEGGEENDLKVLDRKVYRADSPEVTDIKINIKPDVNQLNSKDDFEDDEGDKSVELIQSDKNEDKSKIDISDDEMNENKHMDEADQDNEARPLHKTLSIFIKNIHPNVFRTQLEDIVKQFPGYLRIALQDPFPERGFMRRGWITFAGNTDVNSVIWQLNKHRLADTDLEATANNVEYQRIRPVDSLVSHKAVMRQDVKYAAKLVGKFDKRRNLWIKEEHGVDGNPLLKNITEYLVDEGNYEEEAYLGGNINNNLAITGGGDPNNIAIDEDHELAVVLDRLILYLRIVHSFDYYNCCEYTIEDELPSKCGLVHVRGNPLSAKQRYTQEQLEEHMKIVESKAQRILDSIDNLDFQIASRLGVKEVDEAVEKFITDNTREISKDKWLCPLSGKKFKGPEFIKKHIYNKFSDRIETVKETVKYFNNYVLDPQRPQLPEHISNRPKVEKKIEPQNSRNYMRGGDNDDDMGSFTQRNYQRRDYPRRNFNNNNDDDRRGGGRYYQNDFKMKSHYSRNIMNYNDVQH